MHQSLKSGWWTNSYEQVTASPREPTNNQKNGFSQNDWHVSRICLCLSKYKRSQRPWAGCWLFHCPNASCFMLPLVIAISIVIKTMSMVWVCTVSHVTMSSDKACDTRALADLSLRFGGPCQRVGNASHRFTSINIRFPAIAAVFWLPENHSDQRIKP